MEGPDRASVLLLSSDVFRLHGVSGFIFCCPEWPQVLKCFG